MKIVSSSSALQLLAVMSWTAAPTSAELIISEIAAKGSTSVCQGNDWIEIYNNGPDEDLDIDPDIVYPSDLSGYILHDDKGPNSADAFVFPVTTFPFTTGEYLLLCTKLTSSDADADGTLLFSPQFGIGGDDTITLATNGTNGTYAVISSIGPLPNIILLDDSTEDVSYAWNTETGLYDYTSTPTPGASNVMTLPATTTTEEQVAALKVQLTAQNALGTQFFNMDDRGYPVTDGMDTVVDVRVTMLDDDYQYLTQNASYEMYSPFQSVQVMARDDPDDVLLDLTDDTSNNGFRIRPKGQSTLYFPLCLGSTNFPLQLDFSNSNQTLFGADRVYLRIHLGDYSYARDYAYNRMAARFGLPHLRARKVRFFVNDQLHGFYTLLEAPDQEYVFHRNFPLFDPTNYALYKIKTLSLGCGQYDEEQLARADARMANPTEATPPYAFERGEHKPLVPLQGPEALEGCFGAFFAGIFGTFEDSVLAYVRDGKSCPDMLLSEGLIDRDLGTSTWDGNMKEFIASGVFENSIDVTSLEAPTADTVFFEPAKWVDVDHTLKMIAFYAVTMNYDSPLGNGNNYYWLQSGEEATGGTGGWKIFPYDFNVVSTITCGDLTCDNHMVDWSIVQPTCSQLAANPLVGPMLMDPTLQETYLGYVREFVETVYANDTFVQELQDHLQAQAEDVRSDGWSAGGMFYDAELSPDAVQWNDSIPNFPLLPTMKARAASVRAQLDAIAEGTYPRGPHGIGVGGDYETWETCPDWRLSEAAPQAASNGTTAGAATSSSNAFIPAAFYSTTLTLLVSLHCAKL